MVYVLNRTGRVATPRPNWRRGATQEFQFKTSIFTAYNGIEQREAMRDTARVQLQYRSVLTQEGIQRHMADLAEDHAGLLVVPVDWRRIELADDATAGDPALDTGSGVLPFWAVEGAQIVISDGETEEAATLASATAGSFVLADPLVNDFAAGASISYAYQARPQSKTEFRAHTPGLWEGNLRFEVDPTSDPQALPAATPATFEGRELFLEEPNWRSQPRIRFTDDRELFDPGMGRIAVGSPQLGLVQIEKLEFLGVRAAKVEELIAFFCRMKGQRTGFYMPTRQNDIPQATVATGGTSVLDVNSDNFRAAYEGSPTHNVVFVGWEDGSYQVNRIVSYGQAGENTRLNMRDTWDNDVPLDAQVCFCPQWRFASDTLTVSWETDEVAELEFPVRAIHNEENA